MTSPHPRDDSDEISDGLADIAVIGMAGRFPGARNLAEFWKNVAAGVESISVLTDGELAAAGVPASIRSAPGYVPASSRLDEADCFDAPIFGYSPREAALMDPQSRVCLELSWHALEDAGYSPLETTGAVGVFASASLNTYLLQNLGGQLDAQDFILGLGNIPIVLGNGPDFIATRVSYKLNLRGPSVAVQTACSSSATAIHLARQSLLNGECDMALAGGVSIYLPQDRGYLYQDGMILSPDGHCRAFDADADGILFGRGGGMVVLKPLARALEDGDRIRAVIKGSAVNNDGSRKAGFAAPSVAGQSRVIAEALADAGLRADSISYVEAHGTGTRLGDPIEIAGLTEAYRKHTNRTGYCALGTVKTNIGHLDVAAGVTGFIKTVLMLEHRQLPPTVNFRRPNPAIDFASSPFYVNTALKAWGATAGVRRAGVSAFGIGGTNVHLILEEAPVLEAAPAGARSTHIMRVTANTEEALAELSGSLAARVDGADGEIGNACYTANTGRAHFAHRAVVRATSASEMRDGLAAVAAGNDDARVVRRHFQATDAPSVAFLFTGLGAQMVGMGRTLYETQPVFREALDRCDALLRAHLARPLLRVLYPPDGEKSPIDEATYGQPVMFSFEYALSMLWQSWGVRPAAVLGHSLGEYAGSCLAGLLPLDEALRLVSTRARLADTLPSGGGMAAAFASEQQVRDAIGVDAHRVSIASINGPESIVMSGASEGLARVAARLAERDIEVRILNVAQAFHSGWLDPILGEFEEAVAKTRFGRMEIPIISNVTGDVQTDADARDPRYWRRHAREVVRFADGVRTLYDRGIRHFLEMGPHTTATAMAAGCVTDESAVFLPSLRRGRDDWDQILESLSELYVRGVDVNWAGVEAPAEHHRVALPLYPFARTRHWIDPQPVAAPSTPDRDALPQPMLRRAIQSPLISEPSFELHVDPAARRFLGDHRIFGAVVFPATGYVESAVEAAEAVTGRRASVVEDLEITDALAVAEAAPPLAQLVLRPEREDFGFEIFSRDAEGKVEGAWRRHGGGRVLTAAPPARRAGDRIQGEAIRARCAAVRTGEDYYAELALRGFGYGPSFQGIESVWVGERELLGQVRLPAVLETEAPAYRFHPALLDSCLQLVLGLVPPGRVFLPIRIGRLELGDWQPRLLVHAVLRAAPSGATTLHSDVRIANERGDVIAEVSGIVLQEAASRHFAAGSAREWERWLYELTWRVSPLVRDAAGTNGRHARRRWLIVDDESGTGARLAKRAGAIGADVTVVSTEAIDVDTAAALSAAANGASLDACVLIAGNVSDTSDTKTMLALTQALALHPAGAGARLWVVTRGAQGVLSSDELPGVFSASTWGLANVVALEIPELACSCIDVDAADDATDAAVVNELFERSAESKVAVRGGERYVARLGRAAALSVDARPPAGSTRRLESSEPGLLDALRYVTAPRRQPGRGEVEIEVRAAGLNFKDVLLALGRFPGMVAALGHECAGEIVAVGAGVEDFAVGDAVVAFAPGSLATHVIADVNLVARKPASLSFEQAATIPGGFLTAHHALHTLAKIGPDDRVLIHAATGGVGLAAVQLARRAGATIFATAGSDAKRALLSAMGVQHVFSSRTTEFAEAIDRLTGGKGVTVVLNSLTGDVLEKSVAVLATGGRFVELGLGSEPSREARERLDRDASYFNPNVAQECMAEPARFTHVLRELFVSVARAELSPLPHRTFDAANTVRAFRLMARAGHIGKVVVRQGARDGAADAIVPDATYLITGGLGGLGLLVAERLVDRGARHLALMSRRVPGAAEEAALDRLTGRGVHVLVVTGDVARKDDVALAMSRIATECPPLRGVIQSAGVLDDGVLGQQSWDRFARVLEPKVAGSWNLHEATSAMDLDFFVLFSSLASLLGSQGQGNHAAANAFLDALAGHRRARGLPALSINWGAWSGVGVAARRNIGSRVAGRGWGEITPDAGLAVLEHVLGWSRSQVGAAPMDWQAYRRIFADGKEPRFLSDLMLAAPAKTPVRESAPTTSFADRVRTAAPGERRSLIAQLVREQAIKGLGLDATKPIDGDKPLAAMGLDSLLAVELRNALNRGLGLTKRLSATLLFDYPSINALTEHLLVTIVEPVAAPAAAAAVSVPVAIQSTPRADEDEIAALTDEEAEALLLEELG